MRTVNKVNERANASAGKAVMAFLAFMFIVANIASNIG